MAAEGTRLCPHCDSEIKAGATICKFCREDVEPLGAPPGTPTPRPAPTPAPTEDSGKRTPAAWVLTVVAFAIIYLLKKFYCN